MAQRLYAQGINSHTSGNISVRWQDGYLITPSAINPDAMTANSIVFMRCDEEADIHHRASSEWQLHRDIYVKYPHIGSIVHTHSMCATVLSCLNVSIKPFHYMISAFGGEDVKCAPYALFGTKDLSDHICAALMDRNACLMQHHGAVAVGATLADAVTHAIELERLCEMYWRVMAIDVPQYLSAERMSEVKERFKSYGRAKVSNQ